MKKRPDDADGFSIWPIDLGGMIPKTGYLRRFRMERAYGDLLDRRLRDFRAGRRAFGQTRLRFRSGSWRRECSRQGIRHIFWVQDIYGLAAYKLLTRKLPVDRARDRPLLSLARS